MSDYYCLHCAARTSMMGHNHRHDPILLNLIARVLDRLEMARVMGIRYATTRQRVVAVIGSAMIGERPIEGLGDWYRSRNEADQLGPLGPYHTVRFFDGHMMPSESAIDEYRRSIGRLAEGSGKA